MSATEASAQPFGGAADTAKAGLNPGAQCRHIFGSEISRMRTNFSPNKLDCIQFRGTGRKAIDMQARLSLDETFHQTAPMNGMIVPDKHDLTPQAAQQISKEPDHLLTSQTMPTREDRQFEEPIAGADDQGSHQVEALLMRQTGAQAGCLASRRPAAFERRHQGEATLIFYHQPRMQFTTFFLPWAARAASTARCFPRLAGWPDAAAVGWSSPCGSKAATHR
jgi:hypothetical protein